VSQRQPRQPGRQQRPEGRGNQRAGRRDDQRLGGRGDQRPAVPGGVRSPRQALAGNSAGYQGDRPDRAETKSKSKSKSESKENSPARLAPSAPRTGSAGATRGPRPAQASQAKRRPYRANDTRGTGGGGWGKQRRASTETRRGLGGEQVEGRRAVKELLARPRTRAIDVWLADDLDPAPLLDEIADLALAAHVPLRRVARAALEAEARTEAPQGVLAHARPLEETTLSDLTHRRGGVAPFLVVLDGVTDPHNLGALLRSAVCAGVTGVALPRHRAVHVTPAATKAAAGAVEHVRLALVAGVPAALADLSRLGVWTVGLDAGAPRSLFDLGLAEQPVALVLGAEGPGLGRLTRQRCDVLAALPMPGPMSSLNVASAGAVACFEVARARLAAERGVASRPGVPRIKPPAAGTRR
jgi:23S rRNA (guanosine2251-2'-O)-methyltransferase